MKDENHIPLTQDQAKKVAVLAFFCADDLADAPAHALSFVADIFPECKDFAEMLYEKEMHYIWQDHSLDSFGAEGTEYRKLLDILEDEENE